jgi:hypothetical protein
LSYNNWKSVPTADWKRCARAKRAEWDRWVPVSCSATYQWVCEIMGKRRKSVNRKYDFSRIRYFRRRLACPHPTLPSQWFQALRTQRKQLSVMLDRTNVRPSKLGWPVPYLML